MYSTGFSNFSVTNWTSSWDEMVQKIDGKLKVVLSHYFTAIVIDQTWSQKITSSLLKDLDSLGRNGIKTELASLDPLLLGTGDELPGPGQGGAAYEFEQI